MTDSPAVPYSLLDLAPVIEGGTISQALGHSLDLAQHAERWGYTRFWVAEHHNMPGIASAATSVVMGYIAGGTSTIRVGAGGVMLPNHAPLIIAEQFGTLESVYPGRIDLGLGRAPGTDQPTVRALRRDRLGSGDTFPHDLAELMMFLRDPEPGQPVRAVPGAGLHIPIWLLGSSDFSARLAAELGLPFAFASHFAPDYLLHALELYRAGFKPSEQLQEPHAMVAVNVFAADTDEEGYYISTSMQQQFVNLVRHTPGLLQPPVDDMTKIASDAEQRLVDRMLRCSAIGSPDKVRRQLQKLLESTRADELMITGHIYDHAARLRSFEIAADVLRG